MASRANKRPRACKEKGQSSNASLPYPPALPLDENQQIRLNVLQTHRELQPSRWICRFTLDQLELTDTIEMLTNRLGLWEFLCDEVNTYRRITIEFLSSYEFDRGTRIMTFNLGGYSISMHTTELMEAFGLSTENLEQTRQIIGFFHEMNEHQFRLLTCHDVLGEQRVRNISHPAIRYLQRVLSHTLFARGETASVFNFGDMSYVCSMLLRNNGEMMYMPHISYNLAKHLKKVAHNIQPGGVVRIGGIITKIARALNIPTGNDVVPGYTLVDLDGLVRARLIKYDDIEEAWVNLGVNNVRHRLPLQTPLDPPNFNTWKIVDAPLEAQDPPPPPPPIVQPHPPQAAGHAQPQGGPSMQQLWDFMETSFQNLRVHMDGRLDTVEGRLDTFERRLDEVETEAASANYYARASYQHNNPDFEDDPPTPPYQRRAAMRREQEMARAREEAARLAAEQQAAAAAQDEDAAADDEDDDEEDDEDDDDADE